MPYLWTPPHDTVPTGSPETGTPLWRLELWPYRSLKGKGFSAAIWIMFGGGLIPIVPFIGTMAFWVLLGFMLIALTALWTALRRSDRDRLHEEMLIWPDRVTLTHWPEKGAPLTWEANPYWVRLSLNTEDGKVENYITLKGAGDHREVELGAFLSPEERKVLHGNLTRVLAQLNR
ncbi:DUF2244 domain-containing protein [Celeribacter ethanolicus]|uniref:DUF2244 domain-containing protein n=1 Tax=Celeribacter ethanolicus TaxID=1758178 RepID=UPI00082D4AD7|nr:DUF2244 domain-containing protein [Celeribacter ethanolicus]